MNRKAEIELRRIANILVYFANNTENLGLTKANKLLYYLDCLHLFRYGRVVIKDKYTKQWFGPVPTETYEKLNAIRIFNLSSEKDKKEFNLNQEIMFEYIDIVPENIDTNCILDRIIAKKEFESLWFSKSEIEIMEELSKKYCYTTANELTHKTHNESPYKKAEAGGDIDLKLFLKDNNMPQKDIDHIAHIEKEIASIALNYHGC